MEETHNHASSVRDSVLSRINTEGITPKAAWHFLLREWVVWIAVGVAFVAGGIASTLTFYIVNTSFFMEQYIEGSSADRLFDLVPFFWIALCVLALFYTVHAVRETRRGYMYNSRWLVTGSLVLSMIVGYAAHAAGVGESIDTYLLKEVPLYKPLTAFHAAQWMHPDAGILVGVVQNIDGNSIVLKSLAGEEHVVTFTTSTQVYLSEQVYVGMPLRIVGTSTVSDNATVFHADSVGPFRGRGGRMHAQGTRQNEGIHERQGKMKENGGERRSKE
jgi:hypothetical protein